MAMINGTPDPDILAGTVDDDIIRGRAGDDTIDGGAGHDRIIGGAGADRLLGGAGRDTLLGGPGGDVLSGQGGTDKLNGQGGNDRLTGGTGNDTLLGGHGDDELRGQGGSDHLRGLDGDDTLIGGGGGDTLVGGAGRDLVRGGAGDDAVRYGNGDTLDGGDGSDTLELSGAGGRIVNLAAGNQVAGSGQVTGFEHVDATASSGNHIIAGSSGSNRILGGGGDDRIDALGGADTIHGRGGNDTIAYDPDDVMVNGGAGFDVLLLQGTGAIEVDLDAASDLTTGDIAVVRNFEGASGANFSGQLTLRGREAAGDRLEGGAGTNRLFGRGGNDTLVATGFGDELDGGAGDDVVQINPQALVAVGGAGNDTLVLTSTNVIAAIDLAAGNHNTGSGGPVLTTFEHVDGTAATQSLTLRGTGGANALSGGVADDEIHGRGGSDTLRGKLGNDSLFGDGGDDRLDGGGGGDTVFGGNGDDTILGRGGKDFLFGGSGDDWIAGGAGDDILYGGAGNDTLVAGAGSFNRMEAGAGADLVIGGDGLDVAFYDAVSDIYEDTILGGAGDDFVTLGGPSGSILLLDDDTTTPTPVFDSVENILFDAPGNNTLVIETGFFAANGADTLTVTDTVTGTSFGIDFTIDGSTLTAGQHLHVTKAGTGVANFAGGGGDDVFHFIGSILFGGDTVAGGGGTDVIQVDEGSVSNLGSGISDIAAIEVLANGPVATSSSTFVFLESGFGQGSIVVDSTALGTGKALFVVASDNGPAEVVDVRGGGGDDSIDGGDGADTIAGNGGNDVVSSAGGADSVSGGGGDDMLQGGDDDDWLGGGVGNDILSGGHGADTLVGGRGADFINAGATDGAVDVVYYGGLHQGGVAGSASGADTVTGFEAGTDKVIFRGGAGDELDDLGSDGALAFAVDAAADFDGAHEAALQTGFADADLLDLGLVAAAFNGDGVTAANGEDALLVAVGQTMSTIWYYAESDGNADAIGSPELTLLAQVDAVLGTNDFGVI